MNTLKSYISESILDMDNVDSADALIEEFLKENYKIKGTYTIKNGVVDIKGIVEATNKDITQLTNGLFRFGIVSGDFDCCYCNGLIDLKGAPEKIGGDFVCSGCENLITLEGAPEKVGNEIFCANCNNLKITDSDRKKYRIYN